MNKVKYEREIKKAQKKRRDLEQRREIENIYADLLPRKKKRKVSNLMLFIIVVAIVGYAVADFILQYNMGLEISSTLTISWFSFWTAEIVALTGIKVTKVKNSGNDNNINDSFPQDISTDECG